MQDIDFLSGATLSVLTKFFVGLILLLLLDRSLIVGRLRTKHHGIWRSLGAPSIFGRGNGASELLRFIGLRGEARGLGDNVLSAMIYIHWAAVISVIIVFFGIIVLGMVVH